MRVRDSIALTLPSFFLRLVLGITFLWAGTGKLIGTMQVSGDDAARLANLGVTLSPIIESPAPSDADEMGDVDDSLPEDEPVNPLPGADDPEDDSTEQIPSDQDPIDDLQEQADEIIDQFQNAVPTSDDPVDDPVEERLGLTQINTQSSSQSYALTRVQNATPDRTATDFPELVECQRVNSIALMLSKGADPGLTADSQPITPTMPAMFASKPWPKIFAWAAAITELVAGTFLILGLLTRISAMGTLSVMLVAMWMTQFGPAALQTNDALLGFIPRADDLFSPAAYGQLFWQIALATMSLAVVFLGSGTIGLDRLFFSPHPRDPYLHGDPKNAKGTTKKQPMNPATAQRTEFDRSPPSK